MRHNKTPYQVAFARSLLPDFPIISAIAIGGRGRISFHQLENESFLGQVVAETTTTRWTSSGRIVIVLLLLVSLSQQVSAPPLQ